MPEIQCKLGGAYHKANLELFETDHGIRYKIKLEDGREAILEPADISDDGAKIVWEQIITIGHEVWSRELVQAVGEGQEQSDLESSEDSFIVEFKDDKKYSAEVVKGDNGFYQVISNWPSLGRNISFSIHSILVDGKRTWLLNNSAGKPSPSWLAKLGEAIEKYENQ
ncbi:MAG TPA: hypothetical protein VK543_19605 [Puia sp.]|nr:hypothetical protein [Puia sp.]